MVRSNARRYGRCLRSAEAAGLIVLFVLFAIFLIGLVVGIAVGIFIS